MILVDHDQSSAGHSFNLMTASRIADDKKGMELLLLGIVFCTAGQVMDQFDNIGVSLLSQRWEISFGMACFIQILACGAIIATTCTSTFIKSQKNKRSLLLIIGSMFCFGGSMFAKLDHSAHGKFFCLMLNTGGGYFNSSIWSSAALLSKDAIAGSAFSFLVLIKGIMLTFYPQIISRMRDFDEKGVATSSNGIVSMFVSMGLIGLVSSLLLFLMDCKGSKILWDSSNRRVQIPRYSFAILDLSDRRDLEYDILGRGEVGHLGASGSGGRFDANGGKLDGSGGSAYRDNMQGSSIEEKYKPTLEMIEEQDSPKKSLHSLENNQ
jgi:hypothetical protein